MLQIRYFAHFLYIIFISIFLISISSYAEIITYDPQIFQLQRSNWIKPLELYSSGKIKAITDTGIEIEMGKLHGVHSGFIYDIYTNNKKVGEICINHVFLEYSSGYIFNKKGEIDKNKSIVVFANKIDNAENFSYKNRLYPKLYGTITFYSENYCLINLTASDGVTIGMRFNIFDNIFDLAGVIEIVDISLKEPSISKIITTKKKIKVGQKVQNLEREKADWATLGDRLCKNTDFYEDAIYAYEKALEFDKEDLLLKGRIADISASLAQKCEKEGNYDDAVIYWRKTLAADKKYEKDYIEMTNKIFMLVDKSLAAKKFLLPIKYLECIERTSEVEDALAQAYYFYALALEKSNKNEDAYEFYEKAFSISTRNYFIAEKLIKYNLAKNDFNKVELLINSIIRIAGDKSSRRFLQQTSEYISFKRDKIFPSGILFKNIEGDTFDIDTYQEPLIILYIWTTNNYDNSMGLSYLEKITQKYKDKSLRVLAINIDLYPISDTKEENKKKEIIEKFMFQFQKTSYELVFLNSDLKNLLELNKAPITIIMTRNRSILYLRDSIFVNDEVDKIVRSFFNES